MFVALDEVGRDPERERRDEGVEIPDRPPRDVFAGGDPPPVADGERWPDDEVQGVRGEGEEDDRVARRIEDAEERQREQPADREYLDGEPRADAVARRETLVDEGGRGGVGETETRADGLPAPVPPVE